ncbi:unnamed protein product [Caenorhabditis angaria]|uniref:Major facilitator superfamily (MFS) profile domain-containing protein n=1 Tax=Caenorhabditis angaria TaxID=860376 RepID=A0A9P1N8S8_9PELO|nr:unnamed protein product [Caenorhabditis angaria]
MLTLLSRGLPSTKSREYLRNQYLGGQFEVVSSAEPLLSDEKMKDVHIRMPRVLNTCPPGSPSLRLALVVLSIGAASHFLLFLDSVVDNLLPAAMPFFISVYGTKENANHAWEMLVSSRIYGLAIGCFIAVLLSHKNGRKLPVIVGTILDVIGVVLTLLITYIPSGVMVATFGRLINGIGQGMVQTAGSVMLSELPPLNKRGTVLATLTMWACMGELGGMIISLDDFLGRPNMWHWAMGFPLVVLLPALVILWKAPDSPRYLFLANRESEARKAMSFYQNAADCKQSMEEILSEKQYTLQMAKEKIDENGNSSKIEREEFLQKTFDRIQDGKFFRPLLIALFIQTFVHLDDWLWISYSTQIFETYGLSSGKAQRASLIMSLPQAVISIALLGCFDNFTRRSLLIFPTVLSVIFGILAIVFSAPQFATIVPIMIILPILAALDLSVAAISGESAYAIVPELFLANDKVLGTAIVGIVQNGFGGVLTNFLLTALNYHGVSNVLIPFVVMNTIYAIVTYKFLPETGGKTPGEISRNFSVELPGVNFVKYIKHKFEELSETAGSKPFIFNLVGFIFQVICCFFVIDFAYYMYTNIAK